MTLLKENIAKMVEQEKEKVVEWRRYLHQHPELSFQEVETANYIYNILQSFNCLELSRPTETSIMARLIGKEPGKTLAIRADLDALPIVEENSFEFTSKNPGVMHACGHDGHTAMLLGAVEILTGLRDEIRGEVRFIFQHAEELHPGGAQQMVDAGVMDGVDMVIGIHLQSKIEVGKIGVSCGPINASSDRFDISVIGKGGHAGSPHTTIDSVAVMAQVIMNLQQIVSRNVDPLDPLVLSITKILGGSAYNVIPGTVAIGGTVRSYNPELRDSIPELMERVLRGITAAHGATYQFEYRKGYRSVVNDDVVTQKVRDILLDTFGDDVVGTSKPGMGGEDFSAYLQKVPGTFFHVGAGNKAKGIEYPHHHPRFTIDEDALPIGVEAFVNLAINLLTE